MCNFLFTYTSSSQTYSSQTNVWVAQGCKEDCSISESSVPEVKIQAIRQAENGLENHIPSESFDNTLFSCNSFIQFCSTYLIENHY